MFFICSCFAKLSVCYFTLPLKLHANENVHVFRCQVDLSTLSKEQTHKLELPLEEGEGFLILLVTLTASAAVSISDLSVNALEDPREREEILKRYVCSASVLLLLVYGCNLISSKAVDLLKQ